MQKTFKNQQGREFCFQSIIEGADYWINPYISQFLHIGSIHGDAHSVQLPDGNYQILCLAKDATEDQAKKIIDDDFFDGYHDYQNHNKKGLCDTPKESLTSLLTSLGFKQDDNVLILEKI